MALVAGVFFFLIGLGNADYLVEVDFSYDVSDLMALCVFGALFLPITAGGFS